MVCWTGSGKWLRTKCEQNQLLEGKSFIAIGNSDETIRQLAKLNCKPLTWADGKQAERKKGREWVLVLFPKTAADAGGGKFEFWKFFEDVQVVSWDLQEFKKIERKSEISGSSFLLFSLLGLTSSSSSWSTSLSWSGLTRIRQLLPKMCYSCRVICFSWWNHVGSTQSPEHSTLTKPQSFSSWQSLQTAWNSMKAILKHEDFLKILVSGMKQLRENPKSLMTDCKDWKS